MQVNHAGRISGLSAVLLTGLLMCMTVVESRAASPFDPVDIGLLSLGGRATYFNPKDGDDRWLGGAQARLHLFEYFAIEGSVDYHQSDIGDTRVHSYPVQASGMIYPLGIRRISPFIMGGGGWYYTTVTGPGNFDETQNRFGVHAGGGAQVFLSNHFSFDATYRYIWLEDIKTRDASLQNKNFEGNGHMVTIGLNYHF